MAIVNVELSEQDKKAFETLCSELGMDTSTAFNIFVKAMIRERRLPFKVDVKKEIIEEK